MSEAKNDMQRVGHTLATAFAQKWPRCCLGRTGLLVPPLALGGAGIGGVYGEVSDEEAVDCVQAGLEHGLNYFDTSPLYGHSERRLGLALRGIPRDSYILSTKCGTHPQRRGDYSRDATLWSVENSLRTLGTDYIDLLLVHDPADMAPVLASDGAVEALEELKAQGVIGFIGLGQRRHDFHAGAIESGHVDAILTYQDYNPIRTTASAYLLDKATSLDIGVINGSPLAGGLLAGQDPDTLSKRHMAGHPREALAARRLYDWCRRHQVAQTAVVFQFCLRNAKIHSTITGVKTRTELEQNLFAALEPLPATLWEELRTLRLTARQEQPHEFCTLDHVE